MAVSSKTRKARTRTIEEKQAASQIINPPSSDYELNVRESIAAQINERDVAIEKLQIQLNAERIARTKFIEGVVLSNQNIPEDEEVVFNFDKSQKKIIVFKKSTLEEYQQKAQNTKTEK